MNLNDVIIYIMAVFAAAGITTVPVGCIAGGITAGYEMGMILKNLTPILILVLLIIWGLLKKSDWMVKGFSVFVKDMDERGKVINMAFAVSSAFVFGDHLGFTAGVNPEMIVPVIAGKLAGGISAIGVAVLLTRRKKHKKEAES